MRAHQLPNTPSLRVWTDPRRVAVQMPALPVSRRQISAGPGRGGAGADAAGRCALPPGLPMRVICRCSSHQWRTERARRQLRHRTDRPLATTYVGKIDVELDPSAKPTLQPPTYRGTEVLGPTAVRCRAPLIHGTHATVARERPMAGQMRAMVWKCFIRMGVEKPYHNTSTLTHWPWPKPLS